MLMCGKRSSVTAYLIPDKIIRVDPCIRNLIEVLYRSDFETVACCCGHNRYPLTIVCRMHGRRERFYDLVSGEEMLRKRNFYKKDSDGFYYIPETIK